MKKKIIRLLIALMLLFCFLFGHTQYKAKTEQEEKKPYKILTSGKQITVKSTKTIKTVLVWTSNGHRVVEESGVNAYTANFQITAPGKIFFLMIQTTDGKTYSEKIGVQ